MAFLPRQRPLDEAGDPRKYGLVTGITHTCKFHLLTIFFLIKSPVPIEVHQIRRGVVGGDSKKQDR